MAKDRDEVQPAKEVPNTQHLLRPTCPDNHDFFMEPQTDRAKVEEVMLEECDRQRKVVEVRQVFRLLSQGIFQQDSQITDQ